MPCTCYVTRTSSRGLIPPAPELAQRSPGWSAPGLGTAAAGESPEHRQQGRKSRCRTGGLLSPRGVPVPVTVSHCSCSVGHRKGLGKLGLKRHQDKEPRARPGRERRELSWLRSHRTGLAELLLAGWSHRAAPLLPGAFPASPCCTLYQKSLCWSFTGLKGDQRNPTAATVSFPCPKASRVAPGRAVSEGEAQSSSARGIPLVLQEQTG